MKKILTKETLAHQKLEAFEHLRPEFEICFRFIQEVHGQQRFMAFPVDKTVSYLHALWICECKDRLLSVYKNIDRYEGLYCLSLLQRWQAGETTPVVAFLQRKLDGVSFSDITHQIEDARKTAQTNNDLLQLLLHGRSIMLNRMINLSQAFDGIFALPEENLMQAVHSACVGTRHTPDQIKRQLAEIEYPLFSYAPHQLLAEKNMLIMNTLGVNVIISLHDIPGKRSWRESTSTHPNPPFAEAVIPGYQELTSPLHNNLGHHRFIDRTETETPFPAQNNHPQNNRKERSNDI